MKTDSIFYRLFKTFPSIFFELLNRPPADANNYRFSSVEVKQTAFRIDGVFLPKNDDPDRPFYFSEFQFQPDPNLYSRFLTEILMYLDKTDLTNDWRGLILWASRKLDPGEPNRYWEFWASQRVRCLYLDELDDLSLGISTVKLVVEPEQQACQKARQLVQQAKQQLTDEQIQQNLIELIETILIYKFPQKSQKEIRTMLQLGELKQTRVYQEGIEYGQYQTKLETLPRLVNVGLSLEQIAEVLDMDIATVQQLIASSLSET